MISEELLSVVTYFVLLLQELRLLEIGGYLMCKTLYLELSLLFVLSQSGWTLTLHVGSFQYLGHNHARSLECKISVTSILNGCQVLGAT